MSMDREAHSQEGKGKATTKLTALLVKQESVTSKSQEGPSKRQIKNEKKSEIFISVVLAVDFDNQVSLITLWVNKIY